MDVNICPECKVPEPFNQGQAWLNNGDIVQKANHNARIAFVECENLDPLFKNIGDIIGVSIEHLILNIAARANQRYLKGIIPPQLREMIQTKQIDTSVMIDSITNLAKIAGLGKYEWLDARYENDADDYAKQRVTKPYSVPMAAGGFAGAVAASVGGEHAVSYEETSPGVYVFTTHWTEYSNVLKEKLVWAEHRHRDGDIELEACETCGGPKALSAYRWDLDNGLIEDVETGTRMAMLGPAMMDPIFSALEAELGETIPQVVVEAQRRFVRTGFYPIDILESEEDLRLKLALRGLGNLKSLKINKSGGSLRLDNACLHLLLIGLVQGIYELTFGVDSSAKWELSREGDLELSVIPE
jgi:hypothetical protein